MGNLRLIIVCFILLSTTTQVVKPFSYVIERESFEGEIVLARYTISFGGNGQGLLDGRLTVKDNREDNIMVQLICKGGGLYEGVSYYATGKKRTEFKFNSWTGANEFREPLLNLKLNVNPWGEVWYWSKDNETAYIRYRSMDGIITDSIWLKGNMSSADGLNLNVPDESLEYIIQAPSFLDHIQNELDEATNLEPLTGFAFDPNMWIRTEIDMENDNRETKKKFKDFKRVVKKSFRMKQSISLTLTVSDGQLRQVFVNTHMSLKDQQAIINFLMAGCRKAQVRVRDISVPGRVRVYITDPTSEGC